MGLIGSLTNLLGVEVESLLDRARESAVAIAAIGLFVLIAISFLLVALYTWLTGWVGPIWSPVIIAAGALLIALVLYIALRIQVAAIKQRTAQERQAAQQSALVATAALAAIPDLLASPLVRSIGVPLGLYLGFLLLTRGKRPDPPDEAGVD